MDALTDDLLELILLRLNSVVCLIRAAATCRLWRRVIADAGFLRRVQHHLPPHVLGYYLTSQFGGRTSFVDLAGELHETADDSDDESPPPTNDHHWFSFCLDFLPLPQHKLLLADNRGGLLAFTDKFKGVIVCDPFTRQYEDIGLPPDPEEDNKVIRWCTYTFTNAFLLDADDDEMDPSTLMWRFRVLYVRVQHHIDAQCAQVYVFSARDYRWFLLSTTADDDILSALMALYKHVGHSWTDSAHAYFVGRAGGSVFWGIPLDNDVLTLDECTGKFSVLVLPKPVGSDPTHRMQYHRGNLRAISGNAHTLSLVRIVGDYLEVLTLVRDSRTSVVDRTVYVTTTLFPHTNEETIFSWNFLDTAPAAGPGCVVLLRDYINMLMFSIETLRLEDWPDLERITNVRVFPHELPWPPTIVACL